MQGNFELTRDAAITLAKRGVKQNKTGGKVMIIIGFYFSITKSICVCQDLNLQGI